MEKKRCPGCNLDWPHSKFHKSSATFDGWQTYCKECKKERQRALYSKNRERAWRRKGEKVPTFSSSKYFSLDGLGKDAKDTQAERELLYKLKELFGT